MLRVRKDQPLLWESVLPEEVLALSEELTKVDALLDDERFFAPFRERFGEMVAPSLIFIPLPSARGK